MDSRSHQAAKEAAGAEEGEAAAEEAGEAEAAEVQAGTQPLLCQITRAALSDTHGRC